MPKTRPITDETRIVAENDLAIAVWDAYAVSPGHALVLPRREVMSVFALRDDEWLACWSLLGEMKKRIDKSHRPDGYNVGVNCGIAAGQTVKRAHIHLIPRYDGDVRDPAGGVRGVVPGKSRY